MDKPSSCESSSSFEDQSEKYDSVMEIDAMKDTDNEHNVVDIQVKITPKI